MRSARITIWYNITAVGGGPRTHHITRASQRGPGSQQLPRVINFLHGDTKLILEWWRGFHFVIWRRPVNYRSRYYGSRYLPRWRWRCQAGGRRTPHTLTDYKETGEDASPSPSPTNTARLTCPSPPHSLHCSRLNSDSIQIVRDEYTWCSLICDLWTFLWLKLFFVSLQEPLNF